MAGIKGVLRPISRRVLGPEEGRSGGWWLKPRNRLILLHRYMHCGISERERGAKNRTSLRHRDESLLEAFRPVPSLSLAQKPVN